MAQSLSVLLAEDEPMIALMLADMVETHGYAVAGLFRGNGEAVDFLKDHRPDLAIVDYSLNDGFAAPLAGRLKERGTPFFVISGYGRSVAGPLFDGVCWLDKPFSERELDEAMRACLEHDAGLPALV